MRADICEPEDTVTLSRFKAALRDLKAVPLLEIPVPGLQIMCVGIEGEEINIFMDEWSIDIDGPSDLVRRILDRMKNVD